MAIPAFSGLRRPLAAWRREHWLLATIAAGLSLGVFWASTSEIGQTVRASGQVIARTRTQMIQSANDGVVDALLVHEGDKVAKGQVLARLDRAQTEAAYEDSLAKVAALHARLTRLHAEVFETELTFPDDALRYPDFISNQTQLYRARKRALDEEIEALERSLSLSREEIKISQKLAQNGDIGSVELLRLQQREAELLGAITNRRNKYFEDSQAEMTKAEEDLATQEQLLADRRSVLERTTLTASSDGFVRRINFTTPGAKLRAGDVVMELVPTDSQLVVEAKLKPADIGYVRMGLPARFKLDAFDYTVYGALASKVIYISPDALSEKTPSGEHAYYEVWLSVDPKEIDAWNLSRRAGRTVEVQPGMTGTAEIQTGSRTVLSYLAKPIIKTMSESLAER